MGESPVVVEVPHAGLWMDPISMAMCAAPVSALAHDADLYMDELVAECVQEGATLLVAQASRYLLDLNREEDDFDHRAVRTGRAEKRPFGLVWRETTEGGRALEEPLSSSELQRRLDLFYRPYHQALSDILQRKKNRFGHVVLLSAHSMPTLPTHSQSPQPRPSCPDVVIGSRFGRSATEQTVRIAVEHARRFGWTVKREEPFAGGATTERYGRPERGVEAIQVEAARRLYMNERSLAKKPHSFHVMSSFWRGLAGSLAASASS